AWHSNSPSMVCEWSELTTGRWNLTIAARGLDFRQRRPPHQFKCLPDTDDILRDFIETNERRFCLRSLDLRDFDIANVLFRLETTFLTTNPSHILVRQPPLLPASCDEDTIWRWFAKCGINEICPAAYTNWFPCVVCSSVTGKSTEKNCFQRFHILRPDCDLQLTMEFKLAEYCHVVPCARITSVSVYAEYLHCTERTTRIAKPRMLPVISRTSTKKRLLHCLCIFKRADSLVTSRKLR
ncbi:hypothetical protein AAVH_37944, partial [Aphelenchoides avenae]